MNIIFAGTPDFSVYTLEKLLASNHKVIAVYTQPDRPSGRGRRLMASPVKKLAVEHNIPVYQPVSLKDEAAQQELINLQADIMIVVAYGLILPKIILNAPPLGCLNIHASLLPRWRGAAPIQRAILAGDQHTGITIMQMNEGLDTGDILRIKSCPIAVNDTGSRLHDKLAVMGADTILESLSDIENNTLYAQVQDEKQVTYAHKLNKQEACIDWQQDASDIVKKIQAFNSWPVAYTYYKNKALRLWQAHLLDTPSSVIDLAYGTVIAESSEGIDILAKNGIVRVLELQMPSKKRIMVKDFINGQSLLSVHFDKEVH